MFFDWVVINEILRIAISLNTLLRYFIYYFLFKKVQSLFISICILIRDK